MLIFNPGDIGAGHPKHVEAVADTAVPYVMWAGTPYERLMIPVQ